MRHARAAPNYGRQVRRDIFNGRQAWHRAIAGTAITKGHGNAKGTVRALTARDGAKLTRELVCTAPRRACSP